MLDVRVLGPIEVEVGGEPLALGGPKQRAVLAMLVLEANRVVSVEQLIDGVWGPNAPDGATRSLQVYVSNLRKVLGAAPDAIAIVNQSPGYRLEVDPERIDLNRAARLAEVGRALLSEGRAAAAAEPLEEAVALWRGPVVADLALEPFASGGALDRVDEDGLTLEEDRLEVALSMGRHAEALPEIQRLVDQQPLRERRWSLLMLALYRSDRQADALRTFGRARTLLLDELGIDPGPALRQMEARILSQDPALDPSVAPSSPDDVSRHRPLPRPISSLVGREHDVEEVGELVRRPGVQLVDLVGPGGVGKTRLSLAVASSLAGELPGGVAFVDLAAIDDPTAVPSAISTALGAEDALPDDPDERSAALASLIRDRPTLVVLDNLEQVVEVGPTLVQLLAAAPALTILGTSRVALRVTGETTWAVPPLEVPAADTVSSIAELADVPAVDLFVQRAAAAAPGFELTEANAGGIADICRRLDGLPLALELAAARTNLLAPAELAARLGQRLDLLVGARDLPDRQRTLRATLEWSEALLPPDQRELLARLGVFAGSFTVESAEEVCRGAADGPDVLEGLGALVDSSLVRAVPSGLGLRFRLLQTVQGFAVERLDGLTDRDELRDRHGARMRLLAEEARWGIDGPESSTVLIDTAADEPDHRTALRHSLDRGATDDAGRHAVALRRYWVAQGRLAEGRRWLGEVLAGPDLTAAVRGSALVAAGILAYYQDDGQASATLLEEGLDQARAAGGVEDVAVALCYLGTTHLGVDVAAVAPFAEEALSLARANDLYEPQTLSLALSAMVAGMAGDDLEETRLREERLALARTRGDRIRIADNLNALAEIALEAEDLDRARALAEEALPIARATSRIATRDLLLTLGRIALTDGDAQVATTRLGEATRLSVDFGQRYELAQCLRALGGAACLDGHADHAARLFGAADQLHRSLGEGAFPLEDDLAGRLESARTELGEAAFARSFGAGSALPLGEAVDLALRGPSGPPDSR